MNPNKLLVSLAALAAFTTVPVHAQRQMEKLDRGVIAMRNSSSATFVSWRVLGLDSASTTYNLYRSTNGGAAVKVNASPLTVSNHTDTAASSSSDAPGHAATRNGRASSAKDERMGQNAL